MPLTYKISLNCGKNDLNVPLLLITSPPFIYCNLLFMRLAGAKDTGCGGRQVGK